MNMHRIKTSAADSNAGTMRKGATVAVLAVAGVLRLVWVLCIPVAPISDSWAYDVLARNLARGMGYGWHPGHPTATWPVGPSFLYSVFYRVFGFVYAPIVIFNIVISLVTILLGMKLAERWFNSKVALLAGILLALWPVQIEFASVLGSELIFNVLVLCWLAILELTEWNGWLKLIAAGVVAGLTCYVRPVALLIPAALCIREVILYRRIVRPVASMAVVYLVMAAVIAPWSIRNTRDFGHFFLVSTNGRENLWEGNNPAGNGETEALPPEVQHMGEGQREIYLGKIAEAYIRQHPFLFAGRTVKKAFLLYDRESIGVYWNQPSILRLYGNRAFWILKIVSDLYWGAALLLGLWGAVLVFARERVIAAVMSLPILLWLYFTGVYSTTVVQDRYHFAAIPFIAVLAALALQCFGDRFLTRREPQSAEVRMRQTVVSRS